MITDPLPPPNVSLVSTTVVPNVFPNVSADYRLAIVGDAPGDKEEAFGQPFVGSGGDMLNSLLSSAGVSRAACFVGNVCRVRPPGNDVAKWGFDHPNVLEGWAQLRSDLAAFAPNCILALGDLPLFFLTGRTNVDVWRGSILDSPFGKVVPSIHPVKIASPAFNRYGDWPLLRFDCARARAESMCRSLDLPKRELELNLTANEICDRLDNWPAGQLLSFDIEGGVNAFPCCSVAGTSNHGFIIAWSRHSDSDQGRIARSLSRALYNAEIPKCLQNSLYDRFVLAYSYNMLIRGVREDTMLKQWEIYPELPKGLGTIASIWTREPYYKFEGARGNKGAISHDEHSAQETYYRYCIKDSCVTLEACLAQDHALTPAARRHYSFNIDLLSPLLYMELRGIHYNSEVARKEYQETLDRLGLVSARLTAHAGYSLCGAKGSVSSAKLKRCLYSEKGYPEQKKGRGAEAKVSTDVEALLNLAKKYPHDTFLEDILLHRKLEGQLETLSVSTDSDGRVRCGYNLVGTETGRLTCYTSPTGSGANLQTITKKLRKLYTADEGYWLFQCDLSGADGWTVAAHCRAHGDPTMWDDYVCGLKPALIIALMYQGMATNSTPREQLLRLSKAYKQWESENEDSAWIYAACKAVQHGSNYGMKENTMSLNIMKSSYKNSGKAIHVTPFDCASLQRLYYTRYHGLYNWHLWAKREVMGGKNLTGASGHERKFFGRRKAWDNRSRQYDADQDTWRQFLSTEPQDNTTFATNLALHKLWHDPQNRTSSGNYRMENDKRAVRSSLIIEPLHQVHDALIGQFPKEHTAWAVDKIRSYFSNTLHIANSEVLIPFEGQYGPSWGELGSKYGGGDI